MKMSKRIGCGKIIREKCMKVRIIDFRRCDVCDLNWGTAKCSGYRAGNRLFTIYVGGDVICP